MHSQADLRVKSASVGAQMTASSIEENSAEMAGHKKLTHSWCSCGSKLLRVSTSYRELLVVIRCYCGFYCYIGNGRDMSDFARKK